MFFPTLLSILTLVALISPSVSVTTIPLASTSDLCAPLSSYASSKNIVLKGAVVLTLADGDDSVIPNAVIAVCEGIIKFVGNSTSYAAIPPPCPAPILVLDPQDVIIPAFINGHTHAAMSLFKNLGNDRALSDWLSDYIFPLEGALVDENFCRVGSKLAMAEFLASGTSTFADMYFFQTYVAEEVSAVGMRAFLGEGIIDFPQPDAATPNDTLILGEEYLKKWSGHELISPLLAPHSPYTTSEWVYRKAVALNRKYGQRTWSHCSETKSENADFRSHQGIRSDSTQTATQWLNQIGVLGPDMTCAHSVWLSDGDIAIYNQTGTSAAHCPSSNLKLASGFMRYSAMKKGGVNIALGTDGQSSNNDVDFVEEGRMASLIHKGRDLDALTMPALDALRHMTMGGAKAIGREMQQGSIEVGKFGDFAIFRGKSVKWTPRYDIGVNGTLSAADTAALIVYDSNAYDVKGTVVNGRLLYKDGCYTTIAIDKLKMEVESIARGVRSYLQDRQE